MFNILVKVTHTHEFINCNKQLYFSVTSRLYVPLDVARIFHWGGGQKPQITCNDVIINLSKEKLFMGERCKMKDQKPWPGSSCNQDFAHGRGLEPKVNMSELGDALSKLVLVKRIAD